MFDEHNIKKVILFHDLAGFGRCSLSVAVPVLSSAGLQSVPVPTALLSTHTGGFTDYTFLDLTSEMIKILKHYDKMNLSFDAVYSGFLGSEEQIDIVYNYAIKQKKRGALVVIDPVMADSGLVYKTYSKTMCDKMKVLVSAADVITPNMTEAFILLGADYINPPYSRSFVEEIAKKLTELCRSKVVLTSVELDDGGYGTLSIDLNHKLNYNISVKIPHDYPGTGDLFASVLIAALLQNRVFDQAVNYAVNFVLKAIEFTYKSKKPAREGILIEPLLYNLHELQC